MHKSRPPSPSSSRELMVVGDAVIDSPHGPGMVEAFTRDGLPRINGEAASWCVFACGPSLRVFDPFGTAPAAYRKT